MKYSSSALYFSSSISRPSLVIMITLFISLSLSPPLPGAAAPFAFSFLARLPTIHPLLSPLFKHSCWLAAVST